jgi:mannose-6-phosphate isomerase-like protein (cupin superfamily)
MDETSKEATATLGHNAPARWDLTRERHTKKRTFVRALEGTYGELVHELFKQPRVYPSTDLQWKGGPNTYSKSLINPQRVRIAQAIETHIEAYAPGGANGKHGHMNSAVMFVLKGKGYDVHDGRRMEWEAGDAMIVENACVHQHFNADEKEEAILLVMKAKPLFLFMHMIFQRVVKLPGNEPKPNQLSYFPPTDL